MGFGDIKRFFKVPAGTTIYVTTREGRFSAVQTMVDAMYEMADPAQLAHETVKVSYDLTSDSVCVSFRNYVSHPIYGDVSKFTIPTKDIVWI